MEKEYCQIEMLTNLDILPLDQHDGFALVYRWSIPRKIFFHHASSSEEDDILKNHFV
jgi:hypothetical protein